MRVGRQRLHGLAELAELGRRDLRQRDVGLARTRSGGGRLEAAEELVVPRLRHRLEHRRACLVALFVQELEEPSGGPALARLQSVDLLTQPLHEDVEVADRPERGPQPGQLGAQGLAPFGVEELAGGPEDRSEASRRDAELVELLRVLAEARPGIVREQLGDLARQGDPDVVERGRPTRRRRRIGREEAHGPEGLRPPVGRRRAGVLERAPETREGVGAPVERLDLDLDERLADTAPVENREAVDGHVGDRAPVLVRANPRSPGAQDGGALEPSPSEDADEEVGEVRRRRRRPAGRLELEPLSLAWELELPDAAPVLDPAAQRHAGAGKSPVGRVEVRRRERSRLERLARELGQGETCRNRQLQLALAGQTRPCHRRILAPKRVWIAVFPGIHLFVTI